MSLTLVRHMEILMALALARIGSKKSRDPRDPFLRARKVLCYVEPRP